ncbi:hypothetical protein GCM10022243_42360 [Saccharothrix violaceirubra]|uniref:Uncharacterized protein n=1 Tax=Saccharothrix violaceirubra TaxID=413306 RepID=A0A7W7WVN5_9PSEU|nr:hypothetical protein [Saccharothrix violaceirubra]MBB4965524.1 hypothetical protein [Saccharothrix violaceirubra]
MDSKEQKEVRNGDIHKGPALCVLTSEDRWASVTLTNRYVENGATESDVRIVVGKRADERR